MSSHTLLQVNYTRQQLFNTAPTINLFNNIVETHIKLFDNISSTLIHHVQSFFSPSQKWLDKIKRIENVLRNYTFTIIFTVRLAEYFMNSTTRCPYSFYKVINGIIIYQLRPTKRQRSLKKPLKPLTILLDQTQTSHSHRTGSLCDEKKTTHRLYNRETTGEQMCIHMVVFM